MDLRCNTIHLQGGSTSWAVSQVDIGTVHFISHKDLDFYVSGPLST